ncbi:MAG: UDP-N-acetylmuramoyl-L-alanine--D-glutamate ligase [Firmicutes bacterium]|jgi:UDP-N-acetylmuramoylalanine--D-glutamate ligase|nr:UDP-N-acetylmuramoyl-L-alanine--D-glutamate ligase [Bacillota bacterium]
MKAEIREEWQGKSAAVIGLGVSNVPLIRFLRRFGVQISARDKAPLETLGDRAAELADLGVELVLGNGYLEGLENYDLLFLSPGIPKDLPELTAVQGKVGFSSEIELVLRYCAAPVFGITGSSGKTTTVSLLGEMFRTSGFPTFVGGNIGTPLIEQILEIPPDARVVLELSSFQLEGLTRSPQYALVTNISENHLDVHHTMASYIAAKTNIYRFQEAADWAVFNWDDPVTARMAAASRSQVYYFSSQSQVDRGAYLQGNRLVWRDGHSDRVFADTQQIKLPGRHNVENILAAAALAHLGGAPWEAVAEVCRSFRGVEHRLELVGERDGVRYYNDSIATTPARATAGLRTFAEPVILLAGGYDKKLSFSQLAREIHARAKAIVLFGETAPQIEAAVLEVGDFPVYRAADMAEAVAISRAVAVPGDVVLLSPGCASFGMYRNFAERGTHFRQLVQEFLKED